VELISNSAARNEVQTTASEVQFKTAEAGGRMSRPLTKTYGTVSAEQQKEMSG
jgi:hypothetical protein